MHCAVNALAARVPALFLSYSRKSVGMCRYVYGSDDWVMPLDELATQGALQRIVKSMLQRRSEIHAHLAKRIPEIQRDAHRPMTTLRGLLAGRCHSEGVGSTHTGSSSQGSTPCR
jgi:polysaccharide pyruvyl transferase WcaK-like protein